MSQSPFTTPSVVYLGQAYSDSSSGTAAGSGSMVSPDVSSVAANR